MYIVYIQLSFLTQVFSLIFTSYENLSFLSLTFLLLSFSFYFFSVLHFLLFVRILILSFLSVTSTSYIVSFLFSFPASLSISFRSFFYPPTSSLQLALLLPLLCKISYLLPTLSISPLFLIILLLVSLFFILYLTFFLLILSEHNTYILTDVNTFSCLAIDCWKMNLIRFCLMSG